MNFERKVLLSLIHSLTLADNIGDVFEDCERALKLVSDYDEDKCPEWVTYEGGEAEFAFGDVEDSGYCWKYCEIEDRLKWWLQENGVCGIWGID